jgi:hypothetical protein
MVESNDLRSDNTTNGEVSRMADEEFDKALEASPEIELTVTGRASGREISNPLWFVREGEKLYLVPVRG